MPAAAPCRYIVNTTLGSRVARLNPTWNQPYNDETLDAGFAKGMELAGAAAAAAGQHGSAVLWLRRLCVRSVVCSCTFAEGGDRGVSLRRCLNAVSSARHEWWQLPPVDLLPAKRQHS